MIQVILGQQRPCVKSKVFEVLTESLLYWFQAIDMGSATLKAYDPHSSRTIAHFPAS